MILTLLETTTNKTLPFKNKTKVLVSSKEKCLVTSQLWPYFAQVEVLRVESISHCSDF